MYKSLCKEIKHGVSQGSVIDPNLFLLCINDLPLNIMDGKLVFFADDINILIINKTINAMQGRINTIMKQFGTWISNDGIIISVNKTMAV
jgi:hypothetical protein